MVKVNVNRCCDTYALLDTASTNSFCARSLVNDLRQEGESINYSLSTLSQNAEERSTRVVNFSLLSENGSERLHVSNVYVVDEIPAKIPKVNVCRFEHLRDLPVVERDCNIQILLGQDNSEALLPLEVRKGEKGEPFGVRTLFGWAVNGPVCNEQRMLGFVRYAVI